MNITYSCMAIAAMLSIAVPAHTADAQSANVTQVALEESQGAKSRVNKASRLRMLSQKIPAAACRLAKGIDTDATAAHLQNAAAEFEQILNGLENGDAELGFPDAETDRRTLAAIADLRATWTPFHEATLALLAGNAQEADLELTLTQNDAVLSAAKLLVRKVVKAHSTPGAMLQSDLMVIDIAGRQRMLLQKMSKSTCLQTSKFASEGTSGELVETAQIFDASLEALRFGMASVGIAPPTSAEVSAALDVVAKDWSQLKPKVENIIAGATPDAAEQLENYRHFNATTSNMNEAVSHYTTVANKNL